MRVALRISLSQPETDTSGRRLKIPQTIHPTAYDPPGTRLPRTHRKHLQSSGTELTETLRSSSDRLSEVESQHEQSGDRKESIQPQKITEEKHIESHARAASVGDEDAGSPNTTVVTYLKKKKTGYQRDRERIYVK